MSEIDEARAALDMALAEWQDAKRQLAAIQTSDQLGVIPRDSSDEIFKESALRAHRAEIASAAALRKLEALAIAAGIEATPNEDSWRELREAAFDRNQITLEIAEYLLHGEPVPQALLDAYDNAAATEADIVLQSAAMTTGAMRDGRSAEAASHPPPAQDARVRDSSAARRHASNG